MSAAPISVTITPNIRAYAAAHSLDLSPEALKNLEAVLQATMRLDGTQVSFVTTTGQTGTLDEALDLHTAATPRASTAPPSITGNRTERALAKVRADRAKLNRETAAAIVAETGNPWTAGPGFNRTNQAIITNRDPERPCPRTDDGPDGGDRDPADASRGGCAGEARWRVR